MKIKNKSLIAAALVSALLLCTFSASAETSAPTAKEEVVYANLTAAGTVMEAYVVNTFELDGSGTIRDYGDYSKIKNLTNDEEIGFSSGTVSVGAEAGMFWYQGDIAKPELPWDISVSYVLDGNAVKPEQLAGATGALVILISVKKNKACQGSFFDDYTLQISASLDTGLCSHIAAPEGTVASAGNNKQISFVSMAGSENEFSITAEVHDFEMASMTIAGVMMDMSSYLDSFDLSSLSDSFAGELSQFSDGAVKLDDGAKQLQDGAGQLAEGAAEFSVGMDEYADGVFQFADGTEQLAQGVGQLKTGADDLYDGAAQLNDAANRLAGGLDTLSENGEALKNGAYALVQSTFGAINAQISEMGYEVELAPDNYTAMLGLFKTAMPDMTATIETVEAQLDGIMEFYNGVAAYTDGVSQISDGAGQLSQGLSQFKDGVSQYSSGAAQLSEGAQTLNASSGELSDGAGELAKGAAGISQGAASLESGLTQYSEGTAQLREGTADLDTVISDSIDEVTGSLVSQPGEVVSFVSDRNTEVSSVQFVMQTEAVTASSPAAKEEVEAPLTFWQKLLRLFGLY